MNTQTKPELFAPCFPMLSIKKSGIEVDADNVQFSLWLVMSPLTVKSKRLN